MLEETVNPPTFTLKSSVNLDEEQPYVLALVDPDVPTPQNRSLGQFLHILGGDFRAAAGDASLTNSTEALAAFVPPAPPAGSPPHR
jgi:phosphatidylethanolamine-binding protein (PEBP) family uncharacterized protein